MESLNIKTFLLYALYIVRTNTFVLSIVGAIGVINGVTVFLPEGGLNSLLSGLTILATIFISPVIYGVYYEIIEERFSSIGNIFKTYVPGYLLLLFMMYIPIIMTTAMVTSSSGSEPNVGHVTMTIVLFSLLFIYVVPAYYVSGTIVESIIFGVQFFLKNIFASAPLLMMALTSELLLLLSHFQLDWLREESPKLFVAIDFCVYFVATIVDFLLFIMLVYIIRSQKITKRGVSEKE